MPRWERAGNNFPILVVGTLHVPYTSYGTRSVPTTLEQWHIRKLFLARSQRGIAATKEVVNELVYNFSASCVEVERIESKFKKTPSRPTRGSLPGAQPGVDEKWPDRKSVE